MERCKRSGNTASPYTDGKQKNPGGSIKGRSSKGEILAAATIAILPPVGNKAGIFCILEHKRMSDVCDQYLTRAKLTTEAQYASLRSVISKAIQTEVWRVEQISFITGARSVNKQDLIKNLKFFKVPEASIQSNPYIRN
jgi:hypothetical protein